MDDALATTTELPARVAAPVPLKRQRPVDHIVEQPRRPNRTLGGVVSGPVGVALLVATAGLLAAIWASNHNLLMAYADARSHLTISRRLIDGRNRGFVQIGTVWLPLQHLVAVPFVAMRGLWSSGWAAVPIGIACLVVEALGVYGIVWKLVRSRLGAWTAALLATLTPSVLYLHTTALTEPMLYAALIVTTYALARWAVRPKPTSGGELAVVCGIPAMAAALTRYDGWAFVCAASLFIGWVSWARWRRAAYAWRATRHFAVLPAVAAAWWLWFNWMNYGDPLEFQRGAYSAQAQQALLDRRGLLPARGDLFRSTETFLSGAVKGAGWVLFVAGAFGMVLWAWRSRTRFWGLAPWLLVVVPATFYVLSLYTGQTVMRVERSASEGLFNLRYGVAVVAGLAVFAGFAVAAIQGRGLRARPAEWRLVPASPAWRIRDLAAATVPPTAPIRRTRTAIAAFVALLLVVATLMPWTRPYDIGVIAEGREQMALNRDARGCAEWLGGQAAGGTILIDDSVHALLPTIGVDLDHVVAPFVGERRWRGALEQPDRAQYVFADLGNPGDAVAIAVRAHPAFVRNAVAVCRRGTVRVYQSERS